MVYFPTLSNHTVRRTCKDVIIKPHFLTSNENFFVKVKLDIFFIELNYFRASPFLCSVS